MEVETDVAMVAPLTKSRRANLCCSLTQSQRMSAPRHSVDSVVISLKYSAFLLPRKLVQREFFNAFNHLRKPAETTFR